MTNGIGARVTREGPGLSLPATLSGSAGVVDGENVDWPDGSGAPGSTPGISGADQWKQPVRAATTANITIATALNDADTLDGITLATGNRVLVKDQTSAIENGIYVVGATPARSADMDVDAEVLGAVVYVVSGTTNGDTIWAVTNDTAPVVDTDDINWAAFGAGTGIPAGTYELAIEGGQDVIMAHGSMGSTETFDPTDGNYHTGTLNANCTVTLNAPSGSGACSLELWLTQDGTGGYTITWPGSVTEEGTPDTTASTTSRVILETIDGGTSWIATWIATVDAELAVEGGQSVIKAHGSMGAAETFDPTDGNVHTGTLNANCTFSLSAPTGSGACTLELRLTQDGTGGWAITWPGSVTVLGTLDTTASTQSIVVLETLDGGSTWVAVVVGGATAVPSFATPAIVLGSSAAAGAATTVIRSDATIAAFDATSPTTQAIGDSAVVGTAAFAARRDHKHAMPSFGSPVAVSTANSDGVAVTVARSDHVHLGATSSEVAHAHVVEETHLSDGSTTTWTLDQVYEPGSVIAWNTTTIARLTVTEVLPDQATVSAAGSSGDKIVFDYAATLA